jgi:spore germination cell wall hydrolase CwlJ-like protein
MNKTGVGRLRPALILTSLVLATGASASARATDTQAATEAPGEVAAVDHAVAQPLRLLLGGGALEPWTHAAVIQIGRPDGSVMADEAATSESDDPLTCLTQAVYYEARSESLAGQQAVAQVVMNRTHLSAFPSSICGVVFQRTGETSGCQFSFVCDGSMYRSMDWTAWDTAHVVAERAITGAVFKPLKDATHYHAAWMTPYWSSHLVRIRQIGGHIFYR